MNKIFLIGLLLLYIFVYGCAKSNVGSEGFNTDVSGRLEGDTRIIDAEAWQFDFSPNPIVVNQGDKVKILMTSNDLTHGFRLPEFGINEILTPGVQKTIEFTADKAGTYPFLCSVSCGVGHGRMRGSLIVK